MKISLVNQKSDEEFTALFYQSHNQTEFAFSLGILNYGGGTYFALRERCEKLGLNRRNQWGGSRKEPGSPFFQTDEEYFSTNTSHTGADTRDRIVKEGLIPYRCAICGNLGKWNGKELILQVDHINGDHFDNRLGNLRFLCPNCHTQTRTFGGKNTHITHEIHSLPKNIALQFATRPGEAKKKRRYFCKRCGKEITRWSKRGYCVECAAFLARKATRPDPLVLIRNVDKIGCRASGRKYGVTESTIRKWLEESSLPSRKKEIRAYIIRRCVPFPKKGDVKDEGR
jgi:Zn finger protein HypA/HybF involved in hydrogenase expression